MLDRQLPAEPVARAAELGAFTHTEAWRVLKNRRRVCRRDRRGLAEIGAAVSVFRVSANSRAVAPDVRDLRALRLGQLLAEAGFAVITGHGGPGA